MKTLQELNSKWWWRLLKVLYIFISGSILLYSAIFLFNFIHIYNPNEIDILAKDISNNSRIQQELLNCNYNSISDTTEYKIEELCGLSGVQLYNIDDYFKTKAVVSTIFTIDSWNIESYYNLTWTVDNNYFKIFNLRPTEYRGIIEYIKIIGYLFILGTLLAIFTILLTRILYYIFLGKFNPDKQ